MDGSLDRGRAAGEHSAGVSYPVLQGQLGVPASTEHTWNLSHTLHNQPFFFICSKFLRELRNTAAGTTKYSFIQFCSYLIITGSSSWICVQPWAASASTLGETARMVRKAIPKKISFCLVFFRRGGVQTCQGTFVLFMFGHF